MPKLIITQPGKKEEKVFALGPFATIGRLPQNEIHLNSTGISREHAKIILDDDQYYVIDLESGNGTWLNGHLVKPNEKNLLRNNDQIRIDNFHLRFWETDELFEKSLKEEEENTDADIVEVKLLKKVLNALDQETLPSLEVLNGSAQGKRIFIKEEMDEMTIGRDPNCDFEINEFVISREHATLTKKWGGIAILDLESKNGTFINNRRITEEFLHDGDRIALGTIVFLFRNPKEINVEALSAELAKQRELEIAKAPKPVVKKIRSERESTESYVKEAQELLKDLPSLKSVPANQYPLPKPQERRLSNLEIALIGFGIVIFSFALITVIALMME